jgi:hypothetical protein
MPLPFKETGITQNHVHPEWSKRLMGIGLTATSAYTWFANLDTNELILRCYHLDDYALMMQADAAVSMVQRCYYYPAFTTGELLYLLNGDHKITKHTAGPYKGFYTIQVNNIHITEARFPDALAHYLYRLIAHQPDTLKALNFLLASLTL